MDMLTAKEPLSIDTKSFNDYVGKMTYTVICTTCRSDWSINENINEMYLKKSNN